ncbi:MAG: hypothetical protein JSS49_27980 [Planctomycetes bacterium]|nr:hypothetical protein [Planctomycetota bacterium]
MPSLRISIEVLRAEFPVVLLPRIVAFILIAVFIELSIQPTKHAFSAEESRVPNVVFILADDKYW